MALVLYSAVSSSALRGAGFLFKKLCHDYLAMLLQRVGTVAMPILQKTLVHLHVLLIRFPEHLVIVIQFGQQKCALVYHILKGLTYFSDQSTDRPSSKGFSGLLLPHISNTRTD